jgi:thrombospondin 2/3/4/5
MIDFPVAKNKFTFYLDRKGKRVTIDINSNSKTFSKQLNMPSLNETSVIRSLALSFAQNTITLYLDCEDVLKEEVEFNLSKLFLDMDEPLVKLFRERKYPLYLDTSPENALARGSCLKNSRRKSNHNIVRDSERKKHSEGKNVIDMLNQFIFNFLLSIVLV